MKANPLTTAEGAVFAHDQLGRRYELTFEPPEAKHWVWAIYDARRQEEKPK